MKNKTIDTMSDKIVTIKVYEKTRTNLNLLTALINQTNQDCLDDLVENKLNSELAKLPDAKILKKDHGK